MQIADTQIVDEDIKKDDFTLASYDHDISSSSKVQAANEAHQTTTLDENKIGNLSTPELYTTNELANAVTTQILGSAFSSPSEVQPTTTRELGNSSSPEIQLMTKTFITQIPESSVTRDIGISSPIEVQPATAHECFTDPEANKYAMEIQPILETSIAQIPDSDVNMPDTMTSAHDLGSSSSFEIQPMNTPKTSIHDLVSSSPLQVSLTSHKLSESFTTNATPSNQDDSTSVIQTNSPAAAKSDTNTVPMTNQLDVFPEIHEPTDPQATNNNITSTNVDSPVPDPDQERKRLVNLIDQELDFVSNTCPKLGKHQDHIKKESDKVSQTYDENKEDKDGVDARNVISSKLRKQMPQLHNKLFHETPFCRTIQQRYDSLRSELKLCLLCFSVFPENAIISRRLMVYLLIGEGLIPPANYEDGEKTVEEYGNELFKELVYMNFIEPILKNYGRNVAICKMHPMVRASLVMIADTVRFFDFDEYGNPKDFGKFDEIESPEDLPVIYHLGDPREFFDFFDENQQQTSEKIEFTDSKGNPIQFAAYPQDPDLQDPNLPLVDCYEKPIDTKRKYYFYKKKKIATKSFKVGGRARLLTILRSTISSSKRAYEPCSLKGLKKLYIRGGNFSDLGQYQDIHEWDDSPMDTWNVEVLRLKYLDEIKMDWRELQTLFPNMASL
nr:hypothetical protein [Tanacetum cinerariifolium]